MAELQTSSEPLFKFETRGDLEPWSDREWLLTDGSGSFAMGTVSGVNTRRYHSLLNCATQPPMGRVNTLPRIGEILLIDGQEALHELSACRFGGGNIHPRGYRHLRTFSVTEDRAVWTYEVNGVGVTKTLHLPPNSATAEISYDVRVDSGRWVELVLLPMVALRDFHALRRHAGWNMGVFAEKSAVVVEADGLGVRVEAAGGDAVFEAGPDWWFGHVYSVETERGQDDTEDLFKPGVFRATFRGSGSVKLRVSAVPGVTPVGRAFGPGKSVGGQSLTRRRLAHAAGQFLIRRRTPRGEVGTSVIAGFPWFADWGRDSFISLPGLLLETGHLAEAEQVLSVFSEFVSGGMIPNKFDDYTNAPEYNTVDASLWFIHAAYAFKAAGGSPTVFAEKLLPACSAIIAGYKAGTLYNIKMDPADGLMYQGDANTQLTWMDARYNGRSFTPRQGKAVEINALWYHALVLTGDTALAERVKASFQKQFWISDTRGLYDVVDGDRCDIAVRPNQIFAVSLPNSPLTLAQQKAVVEIVRRELLTPVGLRSLSPADAFYHPAYTGPQSQRDEAYHNGTVWGWLIGPFLDAYLRVEGDSPAARVEAKRLLLPLCEHMEHGCIGSISECFEGQFPHRPVGASAQAWSVAEVHRLAVRLGV